MITVVIMSTNPDESKNMKIFSNKSKHVENLILELNPLAEKLARSGKRIIQLHRGDPPHYFPTPKYIIDAYIASLKRGETYYSRAQGSMDLVNAVAARYKKYNMHLGEKDIIVTAGVTEALLFVNNALIDKGNKAVLLRPYYPQYMMRLGTEEGVPVMGRMLLDSNWDIDLDGLRKLLKTEHAAGKRHPKYLMVTNPHNPTGKVFERKALQEIVDVANDNDLILVSDEIYDELVYNDHKFVSMGQVAAGVPHILLNGSSKNFDSTGFRIGFMMVPGTDKVSEALKSKFSEYALAHLSVNTPAEHAVAEAIHNTKEHEIAIKAMVGAIEKRVNLVIDRLAENPYITVTRPRGSFYIFPKLDFDSLSFKDCKDFITSLLISEGIQVTGGAPFGEPSHFRIVALPPEETLNYAMDRLNDFCIKHKK